MRWLALQLGIPEHRIRVDTVSRNTYENAVETEKILRAEGIDHFLLVTSAAHMRRSLGCFHKVGLSPTPFAVDFHAYGGGYSVLSFLPSTISLVESTAALHEYVGLLAYKIRGYL